MKQHSKDQHNTDQNQKGKHSSSNDLNDYSGSENASASRGGTTDLDDESLTVDRTSRNERGSGIATKRNVTGSDFDGQTSD